MERGLIGMQGHRLFYFTAVRSKINKIRVTSQADEPDNHKGKQEFDDAQHADKPRLELRVWPRSMISVFWHFSTCRAANNIYGICAEFTPFRQESISKGGCPPPGVTVKAGQEQECSG